MEKDWAARFDDSNFRHSSRYVLYISVLALFVLLLLTSLGWALLAISTGFHDSTGIPRNSDFAGHVRVYMRALAPLPITLLLGYWAWLLRPKHG
jgi:ABC-type transport system involved in cytochrome bd biosynthesis fused ATPase/permease subunit